MKAMPPAAAKAKTKKATKKPKVKLTAEQLKQQAAKRKAEARRRQHVRAIRETFVNSGFEHLSALSFKAFKFKERDCDFDEVFVLENVIVLVEHTSHNETHVSSHLINKSIVFGYIANDKAGFIRYLKDNFPEINEELHSKYQDHQVHVATVYCSLNELKPSTKQHVPSALFLDYPQLKYFHALSKIVRTSNRYELLDFLGVKADKFGANVFSSELPVAGFPGFVLPETQSHFPPGYKIASFYISAGALIRRAYVLRRDSWRLGTNIYQRLLIKKKVDEIRRHLLGGKGAFVNNIIVALPEGTRILNQKGDQIDATAIQQVTSAKIQIPDEFNSIPLIDGQHRIFSYFEGGTDEDAIAVLRDQQNLLVTGIIMPPSTNQRQRDRFSAGIFLQINSTQTSARPELIQDIGVILRPFATASIARRVLWS